MKVTKTIITNIEFTDKELDQLEEEYKKLNENKTIHIKTNKISYNKTLELLEALLDI